MLNEFQINIENKLINIFERVFFTLQIFSTLIITILTILNLKGLDKYYTFIFIMEVIYFIFYIKYKEKSILLLWFIAFVIFQVFIFKSYNGYNIYDLYIQFVGIVFLFMCLIDTDFINRFFAFVNEKKKLIFYINSIIMVFYFYLYIFKIGYTYIWEGYYFQALFDFPHQNAYFLTLLQVIFTILFNLFQDKKYKCISIIFIFSTFIMNLATGARIASVIAAVFLFILLWKICRKNYLLDLFIVLVLIGTIILNFIHPYIDINNWSIIEKITTSSKVNSSLLDNRTYFWNDLISQYIDIYSFKEKIFGNGFGYSMVVNYFNGVGPLWSHNDFLEVVLGGGIITLIFYIYLFIRAFIANKSYLLLGLMFAFAFFNGLFAYFFMSHLMLFFMLFFISFKNNISEKEE